MSSDDKGRPCAECGSTNTYLSPADRGEQHYNTVNVCKDCTHEDHCPWGIEMSDWRAQGKIARRIYPEDDQPYRGCITREDN